jgi:hypothetical protein
LEPVVELLDRQVDYVLRQGSDEDFLIQVEPFLRALRSDPRLAAHLDDLREEVVDIVRVLEQVDAELVPELVELRRELVELRPATDDCDATAPTETEPRTAMRARVEYEATLAFFRQAQTRDGLGRVGVPLDAFRALPTRCPPCLEPAP